ncbi:hypothetical protein EVAR_66326_1 [Eumeta japonica]|uniref:Uncharacterized protein n=1 Tax=Eumeta variegata TaxID=151549 RepID=A0A4C1Z2M2_EUMVA|nr:hypothetical protein EVAR_66326_1 [Eumeta japonica]
MDVNNSYRCCISFNESEFRWRTLSSPPHYPPYHPLAPPSSAPSSIDALSFHQISYFYQETDENQANARYPPRYSLTALVSETRAIRKPKKILKYCKL